MWITRPVRPVKWGTCAADRYARLDLKPFRAKPPAANPAAKQTEKGDAVFLGRYSHSLDDKGRIAVPARFRDLFGSDAVITRGIDRCLSLYPMSAWTPLAEKVSSLSISDPDARAFRRMVFAEAANVEFDRQGRIRIPPELRQYAGLNGEVLVVGMHTYVELWSPDAWATQSEMMEQEGSSIAQRLASLI